ncbi:MAG: heme-binding protein [Bdellovibrionales bacterium]|nr:heme-binding protein [Bdellovibrionales bacterium]
MKIAFLISLIFVQVGCSVFGAQTVEQTQYQMTLKSDDKEIREYVPYVAATTWVAGRFEDSQNPAFRILANYIFGDNTSKQKLAMTAPVVQSPQATSEKIEMTAPVIQSPAKNGYQMSFMMPTKYKLEDLPRPNDPRVELRPVPARTMAVITFTGFWSEEKNQKKAEDLKNWLSTLPHYEIASEPMFAGYNPPWTLPFLRRNEVMIEVRKK